MTIKRNWFIYLSLIIYLASSLLILNLGINQLGETSQYPYLMQAVLIAGFFACYIVLNLIFYIFTRPFLLKAYQRLKWFNLVSEILLVMAVLAAGIALRVYYINNYPVAMESDYKFYRDVAVMIKDNTLSTQSNNEYISLFPNTFGYAYILSIAMRIFGTGKNVCLYLNVAFSAFTALFCYGIGRKTAGRVGGISALILVSFWPSQIIFSNINGTEAAFNFFLYGAAFFMFILMQWKPDSKAGTFLLIVLHILCGVAIALSKAIRPMGLILLITCVVGFLSVNEKLKFKNIHELTVKTIFLSKGFLRAIMVLLGYFVCSQIISAGISQAIGNNIASNGAMGYSLMVGMNIQSDGGYNEDMMNFLYQEYERTQSANLANEACMKRAVEEMKADPAGIAGLLTKKFFLVWANDDYATTTNIVTMNNQGLLTQDREKLLYLAGDINNIYYFFVIFLSAVGALFLMKKDNAASLLAVFFVGSVFLLIIVEMQNRYHYYALQSVALLAGAGIDFTYDWHKQRTLERSKYKLLPLTSELSAAQEQVSEEDAGHTESEEKQEKALQTIDVLKAIKEGHIKVTAALSYENELHQAISQGTEEAGQEQAFYEQYSVPENLWEEYNNEIRQKQLQLDNNEFLPKNVPPKVPRMDTHQDTAARMDRILLIELLNNMKDSLLLKKAALEEGAGQDFDVKKEAPARTADQNLIHKKSRTDAIRNRPQKAEKNLIRKKPTPAERLNRAVSSAVKGNRRSAGKSIKRNNHLI